MAYPNPNREQFSSKHKDSKIGKLLLRIYSLEHVIVLFDNKSGSSKCVNIAINCVHRHIQFVCRHANCALKV